MPSRSPVVLVALTLALPACAHTSAGGPHSATPAGLSRAAAARAIRRDIPMTDAIRRAFAAGTRDSTGRPGARYWQVRTEYTIGARLDPATGTVSGRETVVLHNGSPLPLPGVQLRLDQNIFRPDAAREEPVPTLTQGMKIDRMTVDGVAVDLNPPPRPFRRGAPPAPPTAPTLYGGSQTSARIMLPRRYH